MGAGVSLSLSRHGSPVGGILVVFVPFSREHGFSGRSNLPYFSAGACPSMWTAEDTGSTHRADLLETTLSGFHIPDRASADPGWLVFIVWLVGPGHGQSRVELGTGLTTRVRFGSLKRGDRRCIPKKDPVCASSLDAESVDEGLSKSAKSKSADEGLSRFVLQKGDARGGFCPSDARGSKIGNDTDDSILVTAANADFGVSDANVAYTADSGAVSPDRARLPLPWPTKGAMGSFLSSDAGGNYLLVFEKPKSWVPDPGCHSVLTPIIGGQVLGSHDNVKASVIDASRMEGGPVFGFGEKPSLIAVTGRPKKGSTRDLITVAGSDDADVAGSIKGTDCASLADPCNGVTGGAGKKIDTRSDRRSAYPVGSAPTRSKSDRFDSSERLISNSRDLGGDDTIDAVVADSGISDIACDAGAIIDAAGFGVGTFRQEGRCACMGSWAVCLVWVRCIPIGVRFLPQLAYQVQWSTGIHGGFFPCSIWINLVHYDYEPIRKWLMCWFGPLVDWITIKHADWNDHFGRVSSPSGVI